MLELLLVILLIVAIFGHPRWPYVGWGYPMYGGGIGIIILLLIVLLIAGGGIRVRYSDAQGIEGRESRASVEVFCSQERVYREARCPVRVRRT